MFIRVELPWAVFGIISENNRIIKIAPIEFRRAKAFNFNTKYLVGYYLKEMKAKVMVREGEGWKRVKR